MTTNPYGKLRVQDGVLPPLFSPFWRLLGKRDPRFCLQERRKRFTFAYWIEYGRADPTAKAMVVQKSNDRNEVFFAPDVGFS